MTAVSLSWRSAFNAESTDEEPVVLVVFTVPGGDTHYLSSHPTQRLSIDPLRYGTMHDGQEYGFVLMSMAWPDDQEGKAPSTSLVFENVVEDMAAAARAITPGQQADVTMMLVLTSDTEFVEERYEMKATGATYNAQQVTLTVSREPIETEPWPAQCMTKNNMPGLYR